MTCRLQNANFSATKKKKEKICPRICLALHSTVKSHRQNKERQRNKKEAVRGIAHSSAATPRGLADFDSKKKFHYRGVKENL